MWARVMAALPVEVVHKQCFACVQGDVVLEVEERKSTSEGFGKGRKVRMTFGECLRRMAAGDATLYLTTQKVASAVRIPAPACG